MKRTSVVWAGLLATLVLTAFSASYAQAARYGQCEKAEKVAKKFTGDFTEKKRARPTSSTSATTSSPTTSRRP